MSLLGIDVGTTGCKAVTFNAEGKILASAYREYPLHSPQPGWMELDAHQVTEAIKSVIREVAGATKSDPIRALSVSSQGEAAVPLSQEGEILYNTPISFDTRTTEIAKWWRTQLSAEEIYRITGMPPHPMHTICKMMWMREHQPKLFGRVWKFLCYEEYVFYLLGVPPITDYSVAARRMAFDMGEKRWSGRMLQIAGLDEGLFPDVAPSGTLVGTVSGRVAEELGLPKGVRVVTGGHDQLCNALGSGVIETGMAAYGVGTVECIAPTFEQRPDDIEGMLRNNFTCSPHVVPGLHVTFAFNFTGGCLLKWYRDTFGQMEKQEAERRGKDAYEIIVSDLPDGPSRVMILPHFTMTGTPYYATDAKGAMLGLTLETTRADIVKAILEGVTFEMKQNVVLLEEAGIPIQSLRITGGGAKSEPWMQLKADIMGKPIVSLHVSEGSSAGAAILAGVATEEFDSIAEGVAQWVRVKQVFEPDRALHARYQDRFEIYRKIYPALRDFNPLL
ncbi:MAG: FGGY-family carbohydrate kinase [Candidatus Latescibacterota bacterium]